MKILVTVLLIISVGNIQAQSNLEIGSMAPLFIKNSSDGTPLKLDEIDSELILLDFWAGWCRPCLKTIQSTLVPIYQKYDRSNLEIIGISYDKSEQKWLKSIDRFDVPWKHVYDADNNQLLKAYEVDIIPTYYLIDKSGKIVGAKLLSSELKSFISDYFEKKE